MKPRATRAGTGLRLAGAALFCALGAARPGAAQEFGVYLNCSGRVEAGGQVRGAQLDLALRRNSALAMIQSSDILPAGQKLRLEITPQFYTMVFDAPRAGSVIWHDWLRGALLVWSPDLHKLHTIRMSVDRQSAALQGELRDGAGRSLGRLQMRCEPRDNDTVAQPRF
jgi:hypothetical protein